MVLLENPTKIKFFKTWFYIINMSGNDKWKFSKLTIDLSIKQSIWFGFGLLLIIFIVVALNTVARFRVISFGINNVTNNIQPAALSAQSLALQLDLANTALGFYMLTHEEQYEEKYTRAIDNANSVLKELLSYQQVSANNSYKSSVEAIAENINKLSDYKKRVVELATNETTNFPAMAIAGEKLNPMARQMQGLLSQMIISEWEEEDPDGLRNEFRQILYDIRYYNGQILGELRTFLAFRADINVTNMRSMNQVLDTNVSLLQAAEDMFTFEQSDSMPVYQELRLEYKKALKEVIDVHSSEEYRKDIYLTKTEIGPLIIRSQKVLTSLTDHLRDDITNKSNLLQKDADEANSTVITGMSLGIIIGLIVAFSIIRMISIPITEAVNAIKSVAEGEGDLTKRLHVNGKSEVMQMSAGFNKFSEKVQNMVAKLAQGVEKLSVMVQDVATVVEQTRLSSQQQRIKTDHVEKTIVNMASNVQEVAENANSAAESAKEANENAKTGLIVVTDTINSIKQLAHEIDSGASVIQELKTETESIGRVLEVIKSIAEQTNLLALNAAIEAARAGEQGRGFAVVADEVRTLASRTQESTSEIQVMVDSFQAKSNAAVTAMQNGQEKAQISVSNASNAGESLNAITKSMETITAMNIQIANASGEQKSAAEQVKENVIDISRVADDNAAVSDKLSESSTGLANLAEQLRTLVAQFRY